MNDKAISHYRILEEIGRGGMGVVFKAKDTKLNRTVALKFLPSEFTCDADARERFSHEAQAAAALNHPNICTIYEIDEHEGQSYIAMEYVEGRNLKSMIASSPLELASALDIAMQIAKGLAEAHEKDVIHRDIKPANIMITDKGQVKIMDFGLAKLRSQTVLTREGTTLGTVAYMSPEQARGQKVDRRTDVWSLGAVLFEMVAGRSPFKGEYDQAMIYSLLNDEPEPLTSLRTGVPHELERIVDKALAKDPSERYQTAGDLVADLLHLSRIMDEQRSTSRSIKVQTPASQKRARWLPWTAVIVLIAVAALVLTLRHFKPPAGPTEEPPVQRLKMLVVLPFENLGPPEDEYFADGITDAITARLAGLSGLGIISRQSAVQYKGREKGTKEIAEELGVDYILEGTIQRERPSDPRSRVRIIPQLIRCADDIHLWADTYDEDMTEVFRLQSEIAERVASELDVTLLEPERRALAAKPTENLEAYEYYLRGIEFNDLRVNEEASLKSVRMFEKAVELDPSFAIAWAQLSMGYTWLYWRSFDQSREALTDAKTAVDKVMRIDPDLPEGHMALGFIHYYGSRDYERALENFYKVQKQRPGNVEANEAIGFIKRRQGKWEEALRIFERTLKVNPRSYMANWDHLGNTNLLMRRYDEAEKYIDRALSLAPDIPSAYFSKAAIAVLRDGDRELAKSYLKEAIDHTPPARRCVLSGYADLSFIRIVYDSLCDIADHMNLTKCTPLNAYEAAVVKLSQALCSIGNTKSGDTAALLDSARVILERDFEGERRQSAGNYALLGFVYAYLGRKEDAIRAGKRAVELLPIARDAFDGTANVQNLAEIYMVVGEYEAAIDQLEILLSVPSTTSANALRLDPIWDQLRDNPRFKKLLAGYSEG